MLTASRGRAPRTPTEYFATLPEPLRKDMRTLHNVVRKAAPKLKPVVVPNGVGRRTQLGYGPWHYRYPTGREGDTFVVAIAPTAQGISIYVMATRDDSHMHPTGSSRTQWLPEIYSKRLGRASCGKSCVRIRKASDLDLDALADMVGEAAAIHGKAR